MLKTNLSLLAAPLLILAGLAAAAPPDSDAFLLDTTIIWSPPRNEQHRPGMAFDGVNYLVVWSDARDGDALYCARVTPDQHVLDTAGVVVARYSDYNCVPDVAVGDSCCLVVWNDTAVRGARVARDGRVVDLNGFQISPPGAPAAYPGVTFDGSNWLVAWSDGTDIYGARVDASGHVLDPGGILITSEAGYKFVRGMSSDGNNSLVVWNRNSSSMEAARVTRDGEVLGSIRVAPASDSAWRGDAAFDGTNYLVVWSRLGDQVFGRRVTAGGAVLDSAPIRVSATGSMADDPTASFNGENFLVTWWVGSGPRRYSIVAARIASSGVVLDPNGIQVRSDTTCAYLPVAATADTTSLVAWMDGHFEYADIFAARVTRGGAVLDSGGVLVAAAPQWQDEPSVAYGRGAYLTAWADHRQGLISTGICAARVSNSGTVLDPGPISVAHGLARRAETAVAAGDSCYLVTWPEYRPDSGSRILAARVNPAGAVLDTAPLRLDTASSYKSQPSAGFAGSLFVAAWLDGERTFARTISQSGTLGNLFRLDTAGGLSDRYYLHVATSDSVHLVAWNSRPDGRDSVGIYAVRVSSDGVLLDTGEVPITMRSSDYDDFGVASDGNGFLVAWTPMYDDGVFATRISATGEVLDSVGISVPTPGAYASSPSACFDGQDYVICWYQMPWTGPPYEADLHGARVSPSGTIIDTFPVATEPGNQLHPALARGSDGQVMLAYSGFADSINGRPANTTRIWGKLSPFVGLADAHKATGIARTISARPNPFRTSLLIHLTTGPLDHSTTSVRIYDTAGRLIASSADPNSALVATPSGYVWKPSSDTRASVYVVRVKTAERAATTRVVFAP